ncbi:MAG TPA: type II CAAX endopeptidase family protein [Gemmatimonadaceae bacterium]|nr:type II CAAX endopeptidase family protein [Gemmatimonadaceae bacterium]
MTTPAAARSRVSRSLRPFWLILAFYVIAFLTLGVLQTLAGWIGGAAAIDTREAPYQWLALLSVVFATWIMLRRVEKVPWSTVGLDRAAASPPVLIKGAAYGAVTIGVASMMLLATRMMRVDPTVPGSWWGQAGLSAIVLMPAAFFEELFIHGYAFAVLRRAGGWRLALIVTSVVFGILHAWNPGADAESILAVIVAGFFLGAILLATKSLYAAGAAHFAWNWVMSGALHIAVSGIPSADPDYRVVETGPDWLTGGPWGPEGGLAAVAVMLVAIFYLYARYLRRMEWRA